MEVENDKVIEKDCLNLLEFSAKVSEKEKNQLFQWVMPLHLDDVENLDPWITIHAWKSSIGFESMLFKEVHSERFSKDTRDSFQ